MNGVMSLLESASTLNMVVVVLALVGGFFAFRNGRRAETVKVQKETIEALLQRMDTLEKRTDELVRENAHLALVIETIQSAMKQIGVAVTIDGDLVTISSSNGSASSQRKKVTTTVAKTVKKEEA
jgi:regulator of replication initiation timing